MPQANFVRTIHHGLPEKLLTPRPVKPSYLAVLGRIAPEKGVDRAIRIAIRCGIPLKIAAKVDRADQEYYDTLIKPMIDHPLVEYIGEIGDHEKSDFLSGAIGLLVPIDWPEPFGLVMIEAMACGTPVIAYNRGSVPEIIEDGKTGFIVEDEISAVSDVGRLPELDRGAIRRQFEARFTARRMALDYLDTYQGMIDAVTAAHKTGEQRGVTSQGNRRGEGTRKSTRDGMQHRRGETTASTYWSPNAPVIVLVRQPEPPEIFCHSVEDGGRKNHRLFEF